MTGQAEIIDNVLQHFEDCGGLAPSGSTNIEELLAVSSLALMPLNGNEMSDSEKPPGNQRFKNLDRRAG